MTATFLVDAFSLDSTHSWIKGKMEVYDLKYFDGESSSLLRLDTIRLDCTEKSITIQNMAWATTLSIAGFIKKYPFQKDMVGLTIPHISIQGIDFVQAFERENVTCKKVEINLPNLNIYRNRQLRADQAEKPLFSELLQSSSIPIKVDSIQIAKGLIRYKEQYHPSSLGRIIFSNVGGHILHVNSTSDESIVINAEANVQSEGKLKVAIRLGDQHRLTKVNGTLSSMKLSSFNSMAVPLAGVNITSGQLNHMNFSFMYDGRKSTGDLSMDYSNLKVALQDAQTGNANFLQHMGSFVANTLKVRSNNLSSRGNFVKGTIAFERDQTKSEISYWWKSLYSGIKSTVWIQN
ncbi:DUF748 domain-containing protein [Reichenbachiella sp.]|uniref:DUF748 domain-containing protein n=1 Tax=Reichenbachiella sp. TaxID=2184521 RepID=UPI003BB0CDAC